MTHTRHNAIVGLSVLMVLASSGASSSSAATTTTHYTSAAATLVNPERGFFRQHDHCEQQPFDHMQLLKNRRTKAISLMRCVFYLRKQLDITDEIAEFDRQAARLRAAGMKMILRFAYWPYDVTHDPPEAGLDAPPALVQAHLNRLADVLRRNSDVIAVMESGFVGSWGEGYYTQNFGDQGVVSADQWSARNAVVSKLLAILPRRKVLVRTLRFKSHMFPGPPEVNGEPRLKPATPADFSAGTDIARVGHVNDCFLADLTDQGTFTLDPEGVDDAEHVNKEKALLADDTRFVPMGGETCATSARSTCPTALSEMRRFHYSYMHWDYHPDVVADWTAMGCLAPLDPGAESMQRQLGYRFSLLSATSNTTVARGAKLPLSIKIRNRGWARTINTRAVRLVLRHADTGAVRTFPFTSTRAWRPEGLKTVSRQITIPMTMRPGTYDLLLSLPDPAPTLATPSRRRFYSIRLANRGLWDKLPSGARTGFNKLRRTVQVH